MRYVFILLVGFVLGLAAPGVFADDLSTIKWTYSSERVDGSALPDAEIKGARVYWSDGVSENYTNQADVAFPLASFVLPFSDVERQAVVTQIDSDGRESAFSASTILKAGIVGWKPLPKSPTGVNASNSSETAAP